jgi:hypothetical protein
VIIFLCDFKNRIGAWRKLGAMSGPVKDATFERSLSARVNTVRRQGYQGILIFARDLRSALSGIPYAASVVCLACISGTSWCAAHASRFETAPDHQQALPQRFVFEMVISQHGRER